MPWGIGPWGLGSWGIGGPPPPPVPPIPTAQGKTYLVTPSGNDFTGDGSFVAPFRTIARAAAVAVFFPAEAIEVIGTVTETALIHDASGFHVLRGLGVTLSTININIPGDWMTFNSSGSPSLLVVGLTINVLSATRLFVGTASDTTRGTVTAARSKISLIDGSVVMALSGPDPQTFVPDLTMDILHCIVEGPDGDHGGCAFSNVGAPSHASAARNCIFQRLTAVNAEGTQPIDSDANIYFDNERDLTLGPYGQLDQRNTDPQLVVSTANPILGSPAIASGEDLVYGYGYPIRAPLEEVGLLFNGTAPTIGIVDVITTGARAFGTPTNIHTILLALAQESQNRRNDLDQIERDRSLIGASGIELSRRFGTLYGVPFSSGNTEAYRTALREISTAVLQGAPTWHAMRRAAQVLFGRLAPLSRVDFNDTYHFKIGKHLKIWGDYSGGSPTFVFYLTDGEIQLEDRWIKVRLASFTVAHTTAVYTVYVDGSNAMSIDQEAIVTTSTSAVPDEAPVTLPGKLTFRNGETDVVTDTDFPPSVVPHRRLTTGFFASDYVIESVADSRHLTLRNPFPEEDHVGVAYVVVPNHIFGTVAVDAAGGVTRIVCPGRIGRSLRPRTHEGKAFGYALTLDANGTALAGAQAAVVALFDILGRTHPIHKRGLFRLRDDIQSLVLTQPWPFGEQSTADYLEQFDPGWPL